jgi:hypothetical protein
MYSPFISFVANSQQSARHKYAEAADIWEHLAAALGGNGWQSLDAVIVEKVAVCQKELGKTTKYPFFDENFMLPLTTRQKSLTILYIR